MNSLIITIDLDWACEAAIEETLDFFRDKKVSPTVFTTHNSKVVEACLNEMDVGLHPFFGENSSHGSSIAEVVNTVMDLPHNFQAFRCHRYGICNLSRQAMVDAGMRISSNVCTNLEIIRPFQDRCGLLEVPIFLEDGGYLWQKHPLEITPHFQAALNNPGAKVLVIHPMHFAINTPCFSYMYDIKQSISRQDWNQMDTSLLNKLRWTGRGIRDFIIDLLDLVPETMSLKSLYHAVLKQRDLPSLLPE